MKTSQKFDICTSCSCKTCVNDIGLMVGHYACGYCRTKVCTECIGEFICEEGSCAEYIKEEIEDENNDD